jgi:hypothetical protein
MKRAALVGLLASIMAIGLAFASAFLPGGVPGWAPWCMALGTSGCMVATMVMGAARDGRIGRLAIPFAFVFVVLAGGFGLVLALPPTDPLDPTLWLGLPPRAAVIMYGIGLLPLFAVPVAYALTFDEMTLSQADLDRVRAAARALREEAARGVTAAEPSAAADPVEAVR